MSWGALAAYKRSATSFEACPLQAAWHFKLATGHLEEAKAKKKQEQMQMQKQKQRQKQKHKQDQKDLQKQKQNQKQMQKQKDMQCKVKRIQQAGVFAGKMQPCGAEQRPWPQTNTTTWDSSIYIIYIVTIACLTA